MDYLSGTGDPDVDALVDASITSFAAWDIVVYLEHNAYVSADVMELAVRLGRRESEIEPVLRELAEHGVAACTAEPDGVVRYMLTSNQAIRAVIARFVALAKLREHRLDFVRRVLARMSKG